MSEGKKIKNACISCALFLAAIVMFVGFLVGSTVKDVSALEIPSLDFLKQLFSTKF